MSALPPRLHSLTACGVPPRRARVGLPTPETKNPTGKPVGFLFWRRPTLARPVAVLPSGLQRFTSVFGMGTGGATALLSPEPRSACAARLWCVIRDSLNLYTDRRPNGAVATTDSRFSVHDSHFQRTSGSLASTYRFSETNPLRTADATTSEF